jgi:hypothetical protein
MVSLREATKFVDPFKEILSGDGLTKLEQAEKHYLKKHYSRAEKLYFEIEAEISCNSTKCFASKYAILSNIYKIRALEADRKIFDSKIIKKYFEESKKNLELALEQEPYWAQYMESISNLHHFIHYYFGCSVKHTGNEWTISCDRISRALGLPGISPGMHISLECSICGKDPLDCIHIPRKIYEGRCCVNIAKEIEFDHLSLVDIPAQGTTYVDPHPLLDVDLRRILPKKMAEDTISGKYELTCNDLLKGIDKLKLKGIDWK